MVGAAWALAENQAGAEFDAVLARGAKALWLQLGCANPEAEKVARDAGLDVVSDRCIKVEHRSRFPD